MEIKRMAPMMPLCENCGENPSVKRCVECESQTLCQHCEQELHRPAKQRGHKRFYLLYEYKKRSTLLRDVAVVEEAAAASKPGTAAGAPCSNAADTAASSSSSSSSSSAAVVAGGDPSCNVSDALTPFSAPPASASKSAGDIVFSTLDGILQKDNPPAAFPALTGLVMSISVGLNHACALTVSGVPFLWGDNSNGQLGLGDRTHRPHPTPLGLSKIVQVVCAHEHTLARDAQGKAYSWGSGMLGRLGLRTDEDQELPQEISKFPANTRIIHVAAGQYNSGFLAAPLVKGGPNQMFTCGANEEGQCGIGNRVPQLTPHLVTMPASTSSSSPIPISITRIAFGDKHLVCATSSGEVYVSGSNEFGQIGTKVVTPKSIHQLSLTLLTQLATLQQHAVEVACGERHTHVLTREGQVWSFGSGESHQMGVRQWNNRHTRVRLPPCVCRCSLNRWCAHVSSRQRRSISSNRRLSAWSCHFHQHWIICVLRCARLWRCLRMVSGVSSIGWFSHLFQSLISFSIVVRLS